MSALPHIVGNLAPISLHLLQVLIQIFLDLFEAIRRESKSINFMPVTHTKPQFVANSSIPLSTLHNQSSTWNIAQRLLELVFDVVQVQDLGTVRFARMFMVIKMWVVIVTVGNLAGEGKEMGAILPEWVNEVFKVGGLVFYRFLRLFNFICQQHL